MHKRPVMRGLVSISAALALVSGLTVGATPDAYAVSTMECTGATSTTFTPGVTLTPQSNAIHGGLTFGPCVSSDPSITTATSVANGSGTLSCITGNATGTQQISWSNGSQSIVTWTAVVGIRPGGQSVLAVSGTVTGGDAFVGAIMTEVVTGITTQSLQCLTPQGVQGSEGPVVLSIIA